MSATVGPCAYCGGNLPLQKSHILPKWLLKRARAKSPTGRLRDVDQINVPVQDGEKLPLLCESYEQLFSKLERIEAKRYDQGRTSPGDAYDPSFCRFLVSVAWRVGAARIDESKVKHPGFHASLLSALQTWKSVLDCKRPDVGRHPVAFLALNHDLAEKVFDYMKKERPEKGAAPVLHRYFVNRIDTQIALYEEDRYALTWAMGGSWLIVGVIETPDNARTFTPIEVSPSGGNLPVGNVNVPEIVLATLGAQSWIHYEDWKKISPEQRQEIRTLAAKKAPHITDKSQEQAKADDVAMFGAAAEQLRGSPD